MTRRKWSIVCGALAAALAVSWWIAGSGPDASSAPAATRELERSIARVFGASETRRPDASRVDADARGHRSSTPGAALHRPAASSFSQRNALYARTANASDAELEEMIDEARAIVGQVERVPTLEILLLKLAERDVGAAVRAAVDGERTDAYALIATLATSDPEAVWRAVALTGDPLARMEHQGAVASVWLAHDPARAFATIASLPTGWPREQLLRQSAWALARRDPQQAIELVKTLPNGERRELYSAVAQQWGRHDPATAAEWIETQDLQMQGALAYQIANSYVAQQPEEALAWALRISRSPGRNLWSHMIGQIAVHDPQDALRRAQAAENPAQRAQALGRAIASIAARDPALATAYLDKLPPGNVRSSAVAEVAMQVAQLRPHGAVDWLRDLPDAGLRMAAVNAVASTLAQSDVSAAAQMIDRVPRELRDSWVEHVALAYAQTDAERGVEWLNRWSDEAPHVAYNFVHNVAMRDLDAGLQVIDQLAEGVERDQMLTNVMGMVAMRSPETALEHLQNIDDDRMRMQATATVAGAWGQQDPTGARKWATSLTAGTTRDAALSQLIPHMPSLDERISLLEQIQSPDRRVTAVFEAAARMARSDPDGMRALLRRFPLDPQRQQQLDTMTKSGTRARWSATSY